MSGPIIHESSSVTQEQSLETLYDSVRVLVGDDPYIVRFPKPAVKVTPILEEYRGIGFLDLNGSIVRRTARDQIACVAKARELGIKMSEPVLYIEDQDVVQLVPMEIEHRQALLSQVESALEKRGEVNAIVYPFVKGTPLSDYLAQSTVTNDNAPNKIVAAQRQMEHLNIAHAQNFIIGDRWGPNQIVVEPLNGIDPQKLDLVHVDIDLNIAVNSQTGEFNEHAKAFELAQVMYHLAYWTSTAQRIMIITEVLLPAWRRLSNNYDLSVVKKLLHGHKEYFDAYASEYSFFESQLLISLMK